MQLLFLNCNIDEVSHPELLVHPGTSTGARCGTRMKTNSLFSSGPISGPVAFKRLIVGDVALVLSVINSFVIKIFAQILENNFNKMSYKCDKLNN